MLLNNFSGTSPPKGCTIHTYIPQSGVAISCVLYQLQSQTKIPLVVFAGGNPWGIYLTSIEGLVCLVGVLAAAHILFLD